MGLTTKPLGGNNIMKTVPFEPEKLVGRTKHKNNKTTKYTEGNTNENILTEDWQTWCDGNNVLRIGGADAELKDLELAIFRRKFMTLKSVVSDNGVKYAAVAESMRVHHVFNTYQECEKFAKKLCRPGVDVVTLHDIYDVIRSHNVHARNKMARYIKEMAALGMVQYGTILNSPNASTAKTPVAVSPNASTAKTPVAASPKAAPINNAEETSSRRQAARGIVVSTFKGNKQTFKVVPIQKKSDLQRQLSGDPSYRRGFQRQDSTSSGRKNLLRKESGHTYRINEGAKVGKAPVRVLQPDR
eukprot:CAMPEP_0185021126 /NCGR_PEP_ID=MMETSP1103-20130426/3790_1 /TAXON_ID=36769 /ORGANISM="Paraphysomonas bandaiensis, Strain Caron Lab Isolate" /LENGTH=299 /DNA_ID=CAMNT_0027552457 /DNA_START=195 /DNA_END=1094 /DNA_ORIENTATION=+